MTLSRHRVLRPDDAPLGKWADGRNNGAPLESKRVHYLRGKAGDRDRIRRSDGSCGRGRTRQHPGRASDLSGFLGQFVGFVVGFLGLPDTHLICVINELEANCRVCRVFLGVESSGEFGERKNGGHRRRANMTAPASVLDSTWTPLGLQKPEWRRTTVRMSLRNLVGLPRFELGTSCTPSKRASQAAPQPDPMKTSTQLILPPWYGVCGKLR